jgi:hypothetical protein
MEPDLLKSAVADKNQNARSQAPEPSDANNPAPLTELEQWVSGERLLEILWDDKSRPSLQWLRKETKRRMIPFTRRGRLIFYRPRSVIEWFNQRECRPASMR